MKVIDWIILGLGIIAVALYTTTSVINYKRQKKQINQQNNESKCFEEE